MKTKMIVGAIATLLMTTGCAGMMKSAEATKKAAEQTRGIKYVESLDKIKNAISVNLLNAEMLGKGAPGQVSNDVEPAIPKGKIKYKGEVKKVRWTIKKPFAYNQLAETESSLTLIGKKRGGPNGYMFYVYHIKDHGKHRTLVIKAIEDLQKVRKSMHAVDVTIMGIGANYEEYFDIDASLKKAYVAEMEQWMILSAVNRKKADEIYKKAEADLDGEGYTKRVN